MGWGKKIALILLFIAVGLNSGCWNRVELENRGLVAGVAVDRGQEKPIIMTAQIIRPEEIKKGGKGGMEGYKGGEKARPFLQRSTEADSLFAAVRKMAQQIGRRLFFGHCKVIVVSKDAAEAVAEVVDFSLRDHEVRERTWLIITRGKASELLSRETGIEKIPALSIARKLQTVYLHGWAPAVDVFHFARQSLGEVGVSVLPLAGLELMGEEKCEEEEKNVSHVRLSGAAVFRYYRLLGFLDERQCRGYLWVVGKIKSGIIEAGLPERPEEKIAFEVLRARKKVDVTFVDEQPRVKVEVKILTSLGERGRDYLTRVDLDLWQKLEKSQAQVVKEEIEAAIAQAQHLRADIFGFGEMLYRVDHRRWAELKPRWEEEFARLPIEVEVKVKTKRSGLIWEALPRE